MIKLITKCEDLVSLTGARLAFFAGSLILIQFIVATSRSLNLF